MSLKTTAFPCYTSGHFILLDYSEDSDKQGNDYNELCNTNDALANSYSLKQRVGQVTINKEKA